MGRPKKYEGLYGRQEAYKKSEKGKLALKRYESSEARRAQKRQYDKRRRGAITDKRQWFVDTYGEIESALSILDSDQRTSIQLYYGLSGYDPLTQEQIATKLEKSRPTISRINKAAIEKLNARKQNASCSN